MDKNGYQNIPKPSYQNGNDQTFNLWLFIPSRVYWIVFDFIGLILLLLLCNRVHKLIIAARFAILEAAFFSLSFPLSISCCALYRLRDRTLHHNGTECVCVCAKDKLMLEATISLLPKSSVFAKRPRFSLSFVIGSRRWEHTSTSTRKQLMPSYVSYLQHLKTCLFGSI